MVRLRGGYGEGIFNLDTEKSTFKRLDDPKVTPRKNKPKTKNNGKVTVRVKQKQRQGYVKGKAETTARLQRGSKNYNEVTTREKQPQARIIFARHYARVRETIELTKHFYRYI